MTDNPFDAFDGDNVAAPAGNPFDEYDNDPVAELTEGPRPGLVERFKANFEGGWRYGTLLGAADSAAKPDERRRFDAYYEALPQWETPLEGLVAFSGQALGALPSPENFIGVGAGLRVVGAVGMRATTYSARILAGAVDAAAVNAVVDPAIQGGEIAAGFRENFDPAQAAGSIALGAVAGGVFGALGRAIDGPEVKAPAETPPPEPRKPGTAPEAPQAPADAPSAPAGPDTKATPAAPVSEAEPGAAVTPEAKAPSDLPEPATVVDRPPLADAPEPTIGEHLVDKIDAIADGDAVPASSSAAARPLLTARAKALLDGVAPLDRMQGVRRPQSLVRFLAAHGGIADNTGDVAHIAGGNPFVPGVGKLIRKGGRDLDYAREMAAEAGFLDDFGLNADGTARASINDLLGLIDRDLRQGDVFSTTDRETAARFAAAREARAFRDQIEDHIRDLDEIADGTMPDAIMWRAADLIAAGDAAEPYDALERAIIEDYNAGRNEARPLARDTDDEIPFLRQPKNKQLSEADAGRPAPQREANARGRGDAPADGGVADPAGRMVRDAGRPQGSEGGGGGRLSEAPKQPADIQQRVAGPRGEGELRRGDVAQARLEASQSLSDVSDKLVDTLGLTVRQGHLGDARKAVGKTGDTLGQYSKRSGVVRVKHVGDFDTLSHEAGHALEGKDRELFAAMQKRHADELGPLAYDGANGDPTEGFAEAVRLWLTNRPYVEARAPKFAAEFRATLADRFPDVAASFDEVAAAHSRWLAQPSDQAVLSTIRSNKRDGRAGETVKALKKHGVYNTIADRMSTAYTWFLDDLHPLSRAVRGLAGEYKAATGTLLDLKVTDDPYKLARMQRGAYTAGHQDLLYGVHGYGDLTPQSPSLRDALIEATGARNVMFRFDDVKVAEFGSYLWSRRAVGEWDRFGRGEIPNPPDKLSRADHAANIEALGAANPAFKSAADKVYAWIRALWQKKLDAGLITREQFDEGLKIVDYVPGLRHFDEDELGAPGGKRGRDGKSAVVRRFRGSDRDVINPLESLMADAYETSAAIARNDVVKALARLADRVGEGAGRFAERIPSHRLKAMKVDPLEALDAAGKAAGIHPVDRTLLRDAIEGMLGDEQATIFRPAMITGAGENIVFFREGGVVKALHLADGKFGRDMVGAFNMMSRHERNVFVDLLAKPASLLRAGVTTQFGFMLANIARDQMMAAVYYGKPFRRLGATARGAWAEVANGDAARAYNAAGGLMGGANAAAWADGMVKRDLDALTRKGFAPRAFTSFKGFLEATEVSETASRLGLFETFTQEAKARGLDDFEARMEAIWRSRDFLDFNRRGSQMAAISRVVPFLNASLQGLDKGARQMVLPFVRHMAGEALTAEERRALPEAAKAWARLAMVTVAGMSFHAIMSENEDYRQLSPQVRATHWVAFVHGEPVIVPKPFELAALINAGEAAWDAFAKNDPTAADRYLEGLYTVVAPPNVFEDNPLMKLIYERWANKSFFTGAPLVPDHLQSLEPWLQHTAWTSQFGKDVAGAMKGFVDMRPVMIDHAITTLGGSWGRSLLALYDQASGEKPDRGWWDAVFTRRFIKDASRGASSVSTFWDMMSRENGTYYGAAATYKAMADSGDPTGAETFLARQDAPTRAFIAVSMMPAGAKRLNPLYRAQSAVGAIGKTRRDLIEGKLVDADGPVTVDRKTLTAADDILSDLSMVEATNALIATGTQGWAGLQKPYDISTYWRELEAAAPTVAKALADRYATAKVLDGEAVAKGWPELQARLLKDGSEALWQDLAGAAEAGGSQFGGRKIPGKKRPAVPGTP